MSKSQSTSCRRFLGYRFQPDDEPDAPFLTYFDTSLEDVNQVDDAGPMSNYRWKIANQLSATTALSGNLTSYKGTHPGRAYVHRTFGGFLSIGITTLGNFGGIPSSPGDPEGFVIESVDNQARQRMISKIVAANTSLKGMVSAGEFGESCRLVNGAGRDLMYGVRNYLSDVSRLVKYVNPRNLMSAVSRRWLEYSFGWRPLIADIDDGIRAMRRIREKRPPRVLIRSEVGSSEMNFEEPYSYNVFDYEVSVSTQKRSTYGVRYYGCVSVTQGVDRVAHEFGFRTDQFVPTVYELIPYSFLLDYFVNIGAIVEFYATNSSGVKWLNKGIMSSHEVIVTPGAVFRPLDGWEYQENSILLDKPFEWRRRYVERLPADFSALAPSLEFKIPGSSTKWMNMSALLAQHADTSRRASYRR